MSTAGSEMHRWRQSHEAVSQLSGIYVFTVCTEHARTVQQSFKKGVQVCRDMGAFIPDS